MATNDSSGNAVKVKYNLSDHLQWEMWYDIVTDRAKGHEIWSYVDPEGKPEDPTTPAKPEQPQPHDGTTGVDRLTVEVYVQSLRDYERKKAALLSLKTWIKDTVDLTAFEHVKGKETIREMLQELIATYEKSAQEIRVDFDREFIRLKRSPRSKDLETWLSQWNQFYNRAKKYKRTEYTGYNAVIEFLRAAQPVNPTFVSAFYTKTLDLYQEGKDVPTIPTLTRRLQLELRINGTLTPNSNPRATGFATLQGLDTDDTASPAPTPTPTPAPKPAEQ